MQKWYWIELIGFDNTQADYGVKAFLERTQAKVDGVSLLFANLEFVVDYQNADGETELLPCHCSYGGYLHGDERKQNGICKRTITAVRSYPTSCLPLGFVWAERCVRNT